MSADTKPQAASGIPWVPPRHRVTVPMGLAVLVSGLVIRLPHVQDPRLDLEPYLSRAAPETLLSGLVLEATTGVPWLAAVFVGLCGLLLFYLVEALTRRFWLKANEAPAFFVALGFVALPAQAALLRVAGNETLLPALALTLAGCRLGLTRLPGWSALGLLLGVLAVCVHPAMVLLLPAVVAGAAAGGHLPGRWQPVAALVGALLLATGLLWLQASALVAPLAPGAAERRLELLGMGLAGLPGLVLDPGVRSVLPSGHAALSGDWPLGVGPFLLAMVFAFGFMVVGIRRSAIALAVTVCAAAAGPLLVPGWIPGDRGLLILAFLPPLALAGTLLGAFRNWPLPVFLVGLALGSGVVSLVFENERSPYLVRRTVALDLPRRVTPTGQVLDVDFASERDPARLMLYSRDVYRTDPHWRPARDAVAVRLHEGEPALDELRLRDLLASPVITPQPVAPGARDLLARLGTVENRLGLLETRWPRSRSREAFTSLVQDVELIGPEILEYHFEMPTHHRSVGLVRRFKRLASDLAHVSTRVGWPSLARPLREMIIEICQANEKAYESAILGRDLLDMGEVEAAIGILKEAVPDLRQRSIIGAVSRGALGRALAAAGRKKEGLQEINRAWSGLAGSVTGSSNMKSILRLASPASLEYFLLAQLLVSRHALSLELDPRMRVQTASDVAAMLDPVMTRGRRMGAALALQGWRHELEAERDLALKRYRELARLKTVKLQEMADGPGGRINLPTFRAPALRRLRDLLDAEKDAEEIAALDAEIAVLEGELRDAIIR